MHTEHTPLPTKAHSDADAATELLTGGESAAKQDGDASPESTSSSAGLLSRFLEGIDAFLLSSSLPSWVVSAVLHACGVLLLALLMITKPEVGSLGWLVGSVQSDDIEAIDVEILELNSSGGEFSAASDAAPTLNSTGNASSSAIVEMGEIGLPVTSNPLSWSGSALDTIGDPMTSKGGGLDGRNALNRRGLALSGGGSEASESAVELGLVWLVNHQFPDGGWRFDLESCPTCGGACRNSGFIQSTTASTGLALMCFLGAGYTQHEGPYKETIADGLYYLVDKMLLTSFGGDLRDNSFVSTKDDGIPLEHKRGDMYSHAIATLALCEAYAMTRDDNLKGPAQEAVNFIVYAQHDKGGWRYEPKEPGDTSVTGWQLAALKSASLAQLEIPRHVWYKASDYLDGVQEDRGATYGYQTPSKTRHSMSAVGLFGRMMLGWPRDHAPLIRGVKQLSGKSPIKQDMYYNYYATQVLHHMGGPGWKRWNPHMRDYLIDSQSRDGHETGSWFFKEAWSDRGGRLYTTTLSILTLEVYYRYMPMYQDAFVSQGP